MVEIRRVYNTYVRVYADLAETVVTTVFSADRSGNVGNKIGISGTADC